MSKNKKQSKVKKSFSKKKAVKKRTVAKKPQQKKKISKKKKTNKTVGKKVPEKKAKKKIFQKKPSIKKTKSLKTSLKYKDKKETSKTKQPPSDKKQNPVEKTKTKSLSSSLNYREKELQKLLDKEKKDTLILKDMKGRTYCVIENCDYPAIIEDHCRLHFFGLFKKIKKKKQILEQDLLTKHYDFLIKKYSLDLFDYLFKDLSSDKNFKQAIKKITHEEAEEPETEDAFAD